MAKDDPKNESSKNDYSFKVLHEQVADEDLFEDKTHQKVADTLEKLISTNDQGLTIGLEGSWGSGKSTVINLLRENLKNTDTTKKEKTLIFSFDAWAHDGDPLRRIFLESLIETIEPDDKTQNKNDSVLDQIRNKISARQKTVEVKSHKSASRLGKYLSLSALTIPVGAALMTKVDFINTVWSPSWMWSDKIDFNWVLFLACSFSFLPILTLIYWFFKGDKDATGETRWDFFESESTENYTQDITEESERTSIEFERYFGEIMQHAFDTKLYQRVIIVIDNLDRVEAEFAHNIWSTLQTFFQHRSGGNNDKTAWQKNLWFLIPYDKAAIERIWQSDTAIIQKDLDTDEAAIQKPTTNQAVAASFMEKCFQLTLEVPPPVMSAWIDYFESAVNKSLTGWTNTEKHQFTDTYRYYLNKLESSPSPRQMHTTINRAGVLNLQWQNEFSPIALCVYVLCRQEQSTDEFRKNLIENKLLYNGNNIEDIDDIKNDLAGLLFGVEKNKGMQLLLKPEIENSLTNANIKKIEHLQHIHKSVFWMVFKIYSDEGKLLSNIDIKSSLNTIIAITNAFEKKRSNIKPYIADFEEFMIDGHTWQLKNYSYIEALQALTKVSSDKKNLAVKLYEKTHQEINSTAHSISRMGQDFDEDNLLLDNLAELEKFLREQNRPIKQQANNQMSYANWTKWLNHNLAHSRRFYSVLPKNIDIIIQNQIDHCQFNQNEPPKAYVKHLLETLEISNDKQQWNNTSKHIHQWLQNTTRIADADYLYSFILQILKFTSSDSKELLLNILNSKPFLVPIQNYDLAKNPSLPYLILFTAKDFPNTPHLPANIKSYFNYSLTDEKITTIYKHFKHHQQLEKIWELATIESNQFALKILITIDEDELFSAGAYEVDEIKWPSESVLKRVMAKLCKNRAFDSIKTYIIDQVHNFADIIDLIKKYGDSHAKQIADTALISMKTQQWTEAIEQDNKLLANIPDKSTEFAQAWNKHLENIVSGSLKDLDTNALTRIKNLKDKVLDADKLYIPELTKKYFADLSNDHLDNQSFLLLSPLFVKSMPTIDQTHYQKRISLWIDNNQIERIKWLLETQVSAIDEPLETLIKSVEEQLPKASQEQRDVYRELNNKLKLKISASEFEIPQAKESEKSENE